MRAATRGRWSDAALAVWAVLPLLALAATVASGVMIPRSVQWLWLALALAWFAAWMRAAARSRARHVRLFASMLQGLREGDYGSRVRRGPGPIGEMWH